MVCMVFIVVSPAKTTTHVSTSPIFAEAFGLQKPDDFLTRSMTTRMAAEIDIIQEECGMYCGSSADYDCSSMTEESVSQLLHHFCMFLPPFSDEVDIPTALFAFYSEIGLYEV